MMNNSNAVPMPRLSRKVFLLLIIIVTAGLWFGVAGIRLNSDDYQYLSSLAPIQHFGDVLRPFISPDANPSFFRPVANATMVFDFLFFGWSGAGFHLTNLFFHLVATLLVFYFVRDVFNLKEKESLWAALIFGIIASHEYNLVVDTARADVLAAIFVMLTFLLQKRGYRIAALISFVLALLSKEIAIAVLPLLPMLCWKKTDTKGQNLKRSLVFMLPYLVIAIGFYFYHSYFTQSVLQSEPLSAEGAHSVPAFLRNGAYSIGYFILPLDLSSATIILAKYRALALTVGTVLLIVLIWLILRKRDNLGSLFQPLTFSIFTGIVLCLTFERWRLYLPSVGIVSIIILLFSRFTTRAARVLLFGIMIPLGAFHVYRVIAAESEWRASTELRDKLKENLSNILAHIPERPVTIGMLAVPAKLGSASVMQLGQGALVIRAEADRISQRNRETGSIDGASVDSWTAVEIYALDHTEGFRGLELTHIAKDRFLITVPHVSSIILYPASSSRNGDDRRDHCLVVGDSVVTPEFVDIVRAVANGNAKSIEVQMRDTTAALLFFDSSLEFQRIH
jgi:hypothetical protein